jgi:CRISPR/Cas system-associated protein Csm6
MTKLDDKEIMALRFDKEGSVIAAGLANGYLYIYNPHNGMNSVAFLPAIHIRPILTLDLSDFL